MERLEQKLVDRPNKQEKMHRDTRQDRGERIEQPLTHAQAKIDREEHAS